MKGNEIKTGETYLFVATDSPVRKHLEGMPFKVEEIRAVWRRSNRKSRRVKRFFNADGVGARAEELEPLDEGNLKDAGYIVDTASTVSEKPQEPIDDLPF